jgi:hypothetical protein
MTTRFAAPSNHTNTGFHEQATPALPAFRGGVLPGMDSRVMIGTRMKVMIDEYVCTRSQPTAA